MRNKREKGSFTIEAILSLSIFMFAFVTIVSLATIARVESTMQYAIDQTAKEISQYYYIASRLGIANTDSSGIQEIDDVIQSIYDFSDKTSTAVSNYSSATAENLGNVLDTYKNIENDIDEITAAAENVYNSFGPILDDPKGVISSLCTMMVKEVGNELVTKIIAQPLCRALVPKYITSNGDVDALLEKMGVVDGLDGLDFRLSSFLTDQRSINVVVVYQIKVNGFGVFDDTLLIKQTASTAAWISDVPLKTVTESETIWDKHKFERGKEFVDIVQEEHGSNAVREGVGIDAYDPVSNTFTSVHSMNVFCPSYSDYLKVKDDGADQANYTLKKSQIKSVLKRYANDLLKSMNKISSPIIMDDGRECEINPAGAKAGNAELSIIVPEEVLADPEKVALLNEIAAEIEAETGVKVNLSYREKALS